MKDAVFHAELLDSIQRAKLAFHPTHFPAHVHSHY